MSSYAAFKARATDPAGEAVLRDWCETHGVCPQCGGPADLAGHIGSHAVRATVAAALARHVVEYLRRLWPRARTRRLDEAGVAHLLAAHARHAAARAPGEAVVSSRVAGYVANSYGYAGETDRVEIETDAAGYVTLRARRAKAQSRPRGEGNLEVHRARRAGQPQGRLLA